MDVYFYVWSLKIYVGGRIFLRPEPKNIVIGRKWIVDGRNPFPIEPIHWVASPKCMHAEMIQMHFSLIVSHTPYLWPIII